jgi:hypothetical protein
MAGAGILTRAGERDAAIRFLRRMLAVTDDPELKERLEQQLDKLAGEQRRDVERQRQARLAEIHRRDLPFVKVTPYLVLGPPWSPWACAGPERSEAPGCSLTWRAWAERADHAP